MHELNKTGSITYLYIPTEIGENSIHDNLLLPYCMLTMSKPHNFKSYYRSMGICIIFLIPISDLVWHILGFTQTSEEKGHLVQLFL